jgi:hypothetical protein
VNSFITFMMGFLVTSVFSKTRRLCKEDMSRMPLHILKYDIVVYAILSIWAIDLFIKEVL